MYVTRDFLSSFRKSSALESILLWGPRQVGKTTLLNQLEPASSLYLDDLSLRLRAQRDPALVLDEVKYPCLIDEAQYAPLLFPEIKLRIDRARRERLKTSHQPQTMFYITGSNRSMLNQNVKETLAGRTHLYTLYGLSVREIKNFSDDIPLKSILWRGGFPELYTRPELSVTRYLSDYILSFIEKDIAFSVGVEKLNEFQTVLALLAARTGQFINVSEIAGAAGVDQKTIDKWMNALQTNSIIELVPAFHSNLSKRITKMKKLYFFDTGLCARLQGHTDESLLWSSVQAGALFETLVFSELAKTKVNFLTDWRVFNWRTKQQNEIDFVLQNKDSHVLIEAKMGIHGAQPFNLDPEAQKVFGKKAKKIVVTSTGEVSQIGNDTTRVPLKELADYLLNI